MRVGLSIISVLMIAAGPAADAKLNQGNWARMLADRMGVRATTDAEAIALLGGKGGAVDVSAQAGRLVNGEGSQRSWRWDVTVPRTALWLLTLDNKTGAFVSVDKAPSVMVPSAVNGRSSDAGMHALTAGSHLVTVAVGQNVAAPDLRLVSGCAVVEPAGGWTSAPLTYGTLARTLVTAMRQTSRLPAAEALVSAPVKAIKLNVSAPADGVYTVLFGGRPLDGVSYRLDGCEETRLLSSATADGWREGGTMPLSAGDHSILVYGAEPAKSDLKVRFVRRSTSDADYLGVLQAMGVKLQPVASLEKRDASLAAITGGPRHANGDAALASLASKIVSRSEAERILSHPAIARHLANASRAGSRATQQRKKDGVDPLEDPLTYPEPVSPTLPGGQLPDPL